MYLYHPLEYGGLFLPQLSKNMHYVQMNQLHARSWLSIHIYFWTLLYGLKSYSTSVWQVILTPAVLLSLTTLGQCSAGPTGLALPQRADSMTSADLWSFICHICGSRWPNGFLRLCFSFHPEEQLHSITHDLSDCKDSTDWWKWN